LKKDKNSSKVRNKECRHDTTLKQYMEWSQLMGTFPIKVQANYGEYGSPIMLHPTIHLIVVFTIVKPFLRLKY